MTLVGRSCRVFFKCSRKFHSRPNVLFCEVNYGNCWKFRRLFPLEERDANQRKFPEMTDLERTYAVVQEPHPDPHYGSIDVLLTRDVEGVGLRYERVKITKYLARNHLLPSGLAVYCSPENLEHYGNLAANEPSRPKQSIWAERTLRQLEKMNLPIPMSPKSSWTIEKCHLRVALRLVGVQVSEEDIILPEQPVTKVGPISFKLNINNINQAIINGTVYHWYALAKDYPDGGLPDLPPIWVPVHTELKYPDEIPGITHS